MIIELTGPPGAGKSTIANLVVDVLQKKNVSALSATEMMQALLHKPPVLGRFGHRFIFHIMRIWHGIRFLFGHSFLRRTVLSAQRGRMVSLRYRVWVLYQVVITLGLHFFLGRHMRDGEVAVFCEGATHRAVTLFTSHQDKASREALIPYMKHIPRPDLLIFVRAPLDLCVDRVKKREDVIHRLSGLGTEAVYSFVKHQMDATALAVNEAVRDNWPTIIIDNTEPVYKVRRQLELKVDWAKYSSFKVG